MDFLDAVDGQDVTSRRAAELVGTMAGTYRNCPRIHTGISHKTRSFFRIGQHLLVAEFAFSTNTIVFTSHTGFQGTQTADLTFNRHTTGMRHFHNSTGYTHVVVVVSWSLAVYTQR